MGRKEAVHGFMDLLANLEKVWSYRSLEHPSMPLFFLQQQWCFLPKRSHVNCDRIILYFCLLGEMICSL